MKLRIAPNLVLPIDAVTSTFCIVGIRGSGKSTTAVDMAEEMLKAHQQIVVLDPKDDWHGLRSSADGKHKGYPITILGGHKADAPLEHTGGKLVADLIVEERLSCILSMRHFSDGQRFQFVYDLATRLYQTISQPTHLFIDEADQFAPQEKQTKIQKGDRVSEAMMLALVRRLIKQGRTGGLGVSLITQSPATLDKRVMNMCETLIAMRVIGAQDLKAVETWVSAWAQDKFQHDKTMMYIPQFVTGTGLVWSPSWLELYKIVDFRPAETFDSRKTPKVGQRRVEPRILAPVDLKKLEKRMAETIERAKADDPKELKNRIRELEKQIKAVQPVQTGVSEAEIKKLTEEINKFWSAQFYVLRDKAIEIAHPLRALEKEHGEWFKFPNGATGFRVYRDTSNTSDQLPPRHIKRQIASNELVEVKLGDDVLKKQPNPSRVALASSNRELPIGEQAVLTALIQYDKPLTRESLTVMTGYKRSTRDAYIYRLCEKGLVSTTVDGEVVATPDGQVMLPAIKPLPMGKALQDWHLNRLPSGEAVILKILLDVYPGWVTNDELTESTGFKRSTRDAYLYRLSQKLLISRQKERNNSQQQSVLT